MKRLAVASDPPGNASKFGWINDLCDLGCFWSVEEL